MEEKAYILADDIEQIKEQQEEFSGYIFAVDLAMRMRVLGLSQNALAERVGISHTAIGKWLRKGEKPIGKERYKELGMALGMDEKQLNSFLLANCYPRLYVKNPLDAACRFVLTQLQGDEYIVDAYRGYIKTYIPKAEVILNHKPSDINSGDLSRNFGGVKTIGSLEAWFKENEKHFRANDKDYIPHSNLIRFVVLHKGKQTINDMYVTGELPVTIRDLLNKLKEDKEHPVRKLRAKLIVYGLYQNMNENEIDKMLSIAKLQPITEPLSRIDNVLLTALGCVHQRYPYFELNNAKKILESLTEDENPELYSFYTAQKDLAEVLVSNYEKARAKDAIDRIFEEYYTDYADSNIMKYMLDIFELLIADDVLTASEAAEYTRLMQSYKHE